ncbi:hypothetical protein [Peribacillus deserti]|uniref:Uncharacterized protein n=1 Tax=Peribacillus deserti TaxID=673318 RepID=A0A2N5M4I8_9BACI|nr:hypothetical protein [Peribacillus deserti]PLT29281.1 hypothetical protein CUU66_14030 [Peribacillus deserti]
MEYTLVNIYVDVFSGTLYFVPNCDTERGIVEMDTFIELKAPYSNRDLEKIALSALILCHKEEPSINKKTVLQRHLKINSYKRFTENKKFISYGWSLDEGFTVTPFERERLGNGYSGLETISLGNKLESGQFAMALTRAVEIARI